MSGEPRATGFVTAFLRAWRSEPATVAVLTACVGVWLAIAATGEPETWSEWQRWGVETIDRVHAGHVGSLWTSCFVHVEFAHLVFNMAALWAIGRPLERALGSWRYLALSFVCAAIASAAELAASDSTGHGYSGVLYGLLGYAWFLRRRSSELAALFSRFNTTLWVAWLFGCLVLSRLGWVSVGNAAHFAGLASGALLGWSFTRPRLRWLFAAVSLASLALPIAVANVRRPWSANWCAGQAWSAHKLGDLDSAQQWYSRSLDLGTDADWCRNRLGHVALSRGDRDGHAEQLAALRASGSTQAEDLEEFAVARAWYADALERETYEPRRVALQARLDLCDWKLDVARRGFEQLALDGDIGFERTVGLAWCIAFDPDADAGTVRAALERVRAATSERYAEYPTLRELLDTLEQRANESE